MHLLICRSIFPSLVVIVIVNNRDPYYAPITRWIAFVDFGYRGFQCNPRVVPMLHIYRPYETCSQRTMVITLTLFAQADLSGTRDTRKNRREKRRALMTKTISVPKRLLSLLFDSLLRFILSCIIYDRDAMSDYSLLTTSLNETSNQLIGSKQFK